MPISKLKLNWKKSFSLLILSCFWINAIPSRKSAKEIELIVFNRARFVPAIISSIDTLHTDGNSFTYYYCFYEQDSICDKFQSKMLVHYLLGEKVQIAVDKTNSGFYFVYDFVDFFIARIFMLFVLIVITIYCIWGLN